MVPSHRKPVKERALSKSNQARPVGKKKRHVKASYASEDEDTAFTPEWMSPRCRGLALDSKVANILKVLGNWVNTIKQIGCLPGIKIGDEYHWRGETLATSIVDSCRHDNGIINRVSCLKLIYIGEGLYRVTRFDKEIESGFSVYKFHLDMLEDHQQYDSKWKQKRIRRHYEAQRYTTHPSNSIITDSNPRKTSYLLDCKRCHLCNVPRLNHVWSETISNFIGTGNFRFANDVVHSSIYVAQLATQGKLLLWGAKVRFGSIREGNFGVVSALIWRLATYPLLHANIRHLMVNCYSLNSVGPAMENLSGPRGFLAVYSASAISSNNSTILTQSVERNLGAATSYWFCKAPAVGSVAVFVMRHRGMIKDAKEDLQHIAQVIFLNMHHMLLLLFFPSSVVMNADHAGPISQDTAAPPRRHIAEIKYGDSYDT
ncbi:hypothetical protein CXB51_001968 [Gossypium anomalum]|uniref:Peptidase S54 rhomboid domain-containing protein n=1 Tax=Gossypium anomalum TaxID=47600 RepID=A0A8J6A2P0_9ROSI|nr:hypothetical protein CXB51_001968 [Gossypium anomalum]